MRVSRTRKNGNRQHVEVGRVFALPCIVSFLLISFPFKSPLSRCGTDLSVDSWRSDASDGCQLPA